MGGRRTPNAEEVHPANVLGVPQDRDTYRDRPSPGTVQIREGDV